MTMLRETLGAVKWLYTGLLLFALAGLLVSIPLGAQPELVVVVAVVVLLAPVGAWEVIKRT